MRPGYEAGAAEEGPVPRSVWKICVCGGGCPDASDPACLSPGRVLPPDGAGRRLSGRAYSGGGRIHDLDVLVCFQK